VSIDRQKVIDSAQKFAAKGQFDKAIVEYMRIVKEDPSDVRILLKIGDLQVRKGAKDDAIATYSRVASGYDQQGFFLKSIAVYKQILSIDPNLSELYSKLADLYVKLGLVPDALVHLDALASRYMRSEQYDKLVGVFRQVVQIDPTNLPGHIKLAELLSKLGKNDEAAAEFEAGCTLLREAGRHDDWAKVAERLLFHRATDERVAKDLARHYLGRQDAKRALPKLQVCFKGNPKDVETLEMLAAAFRELGQLPKTISVLKEIARVQHENGQQDKRLETYRRVLELAQIGRASCRERVS
jgi:tetratricopeptide (TPR) repeat protein